MADGSKEKASKTMIGLERITFDPKIMGGRACIRGMRITVALLLNLLSNGMTPQEIVNAYPPLELEDVYQALRYAEWLADDEIKALERQAA